MSDAEIDLCPLADGGEGTVEAMLSATGGARHRSIVTGPRGQSVSATWGMLEGRDETGRATVTAVIEMAAASGLQLLPPDQRDPALTSTLGTGQLIAAALDAGVGRIILGIGGSATTDGGCAAVQALGVEFFDGDDRLLPTPITGGMLHTITRIDLSKRDPRLMTTPILVASDVTNPLTGPHGAAHVYGPQKGATAAQVAQLDEGLAKLAACVRRDLGHDWEQAPGAGAAGGLGFGLMAFCGATLQPGIDLVLQAVGFDARVKGATWVLTGEGRLDAQTASGKTVLGVARAAARHGVKTVALVGRASDDARAALAVELPEIYEIGAGLSASESIRRAAELLEAATWERFR